MTLHIHGFWGKPSATVDWCERNYEHSHLIAELFNTVSSLAMVVCGLTGVYWHRHFFERRVLLAFASVAVVGIGSAAFHGTLLFPLQMLDELPMIYSSLIMSYTVIEHENIKPKYKLLPYLLTLHGVIVTIFVSSPAIAPDYASPLMQFISFHISFAILEFFLIYKATMLWMKEKDPNVRKIHSTGVLLWVGGVVCWLLDYLGCELLWEGDESIRQKYLSWTWHFPKEPLAWLSGGNAGWYSVPMSLPNPQLHAWWHVCASLGLYLMVIVVAHNRAVTILKQPATIEFAGNVLPYIHLNDEKQLMKKEKSKGSRPGGLFNKLFRASDSKEPEVAKKMPDSTTGFSLADIVGTARHRGVRPAAK